MDSGLVHAPRALCAGPAPNVVRRAGEAFGLMTSRLNRISDQNFFFLFNRIFPWWYGGTIRGGPPITREPKVPSGPRIEERDRCR